MSVLIMYIVQAAGGSLAQLAASPTSTIEVLTNEKPVKPTEQELAGFE
jgi:RNA processing factor Prp31